MFGKQHLVDTGSLLFIVSIVNALLPQSKGRKQCCDDGILIDSCVARLKEYSEAEYQLLVNYYQKRKSLRQIARTKKCCDGTIHALGFVNGLLYALNIRLQCDDLSKL